MEVDLQTLVDEGTEFIRMRDEYKRARLPEAGQPAFLISKAWINLYKKYIHYDALRRRTEPSQTRDHCKQNYP